MENEKTKDLKKNVKYQKDEKNVKTRQTEKINIKKNSPIGKLNEWEKKGT